jgi:hypothetical protein
LAPAPVRAVATMAGGHVFRLTIDDGTNTVTVDHMVPVYP